MKFNFKDIKSKIVNAYKSNKKIFVACVCLIVVALFLVISIFAKGLSPSSSKKSNTSTNTNSVSITEYTAMVENKINNMLLSIEDVKKVSTFVMVESTPKIEYLTEKQDSTTTNSNNTVTSSSSSVVFEKNGSISTPVVVTTLMPKVTGVFVVINEVSASTKYNIIHSLSVVLNVDESCISILQES